MQVHVRVCRKCGEEYRPDIQSCADCGAELEDVYDDGESSTPVQLPPPEESVDLSDHRSLFQTQNAPVLVPMAERLKQAGIAFHLVEEGVGTAATARYSLLVPEGEVKAALETLTDLLAPHAEAEGISALETHYEAGRYVKCPACGAEQGSGIAECAECGLALHVEVPTCARCGSPLEEDGAECATCGGEPVIG
jgi:predicted amidophosphoribosyltransferase